MGPIIYFFDGKSLLRHEQSFSKPPVVMAGRRPAMTTGGLDNTHIGTPYNPSGSAQRFCYQLWKMKENINFSFRAKKVRFP